MSRGVCTADEGEPSRSGHKGCPQNKILREIRVLLLLQQQVCVSGSEQ